MHPRAKRFAQLTAVLSLLAIVASACDIVEILESGWDVEGVVLNAATDEPVEDVVVEFVVQVLEDGETLTEQDVTGDQGTFSRSDNLGTVTVTPSKPGWSFEPASVTVTEEATDIVFYATHETAIYGLIAYVHADAVYVMNPDGTDPTQVTAGSLDFGLSWSPDRQRLAFAHQADAFDVNVHLIDVDGSGEEVLQSDNAWNFNPSWSPDGTEVAHTHIPVTESDWGVHVLIARDVSTGDVTRTFGTHYDEDVAWSPDGTEIAFSSNQYHQGTKFPNDPPYEIYVRPADGTGTPERLTTEGGTAPAWSPEGTRIAFGSGGQVYVMNRDGSDKTALADGSRPTWSLDGSKIAFVRSGSIWRMDADGNNQEELREGSFPAWRD